MKYHSLFPSKVGQYVTKFVVYCSRDWCFKGYFVCLFDLILYVPSTIFQLNRDGSSWVEPVLI